MRRRLVLTWLAFATVLLVVLAVPLGLQSARREREGALTSLQREADLLAAANEEVVEGRSPASDVSALVPDDARLIVVRPGRPAPPGPLHRELTAALVGKRLTGRRGPSLFATTPVGEAVEHHGAIAVVRPADELDRRIGTEWLMLVAIAAGVLVAAGATALVLARSVTKPLDRLRDTAAAFGAGNLAVRTGDPPGPPEIVALAHAFDDMAARIEQLMRSQEAFVADASHQLRTPLTALRLRLESLDATPEEDLEAAIAEADRLSRLVDALLTLARADRARPAPSAIDVRSVLGERAEQWSPLAAEQEVELRLLDGDGVRALLPDGVLEQAVDNYLDNALSVAPPGSSVTLAARRRDGAVDVVVSDHGPGLSSEDRERAFGRFWRGRPGDGEGVGLGLAIVRQLVEASGGTAWLRPGAAGGTDAGITVPAAPAATSVTPTGGMSRAPGSSDRSR